MIKLQKFQEKSYKSHESHFNECASGASRSSHAQTWFDEDTVDAWRHGDGRYGTDAHFLGKHGVEVVATDICDVLLKEGKELGFIEHYAKENAENLSFADDEFDFVYCKEAYHHCPRPMIALHEMIRVARIGVALTEPRDGLIYNNPVSIISDNLTNLLRKIFGKTIYRHGFESSGNYVYSISEREIEKVALGINLRYVAFKPICDYYQFGMELEKATNDNKVFAKAKSKIAIDEFMAKIGLNNRGLLTVIIFKTIPSPELKKSLKLAGFKGVELPENPYL